jgi:hypothetical protein
MRCYFLRGSHIVGVEMLPSGLSDPDAIARAYTLSAKRTAWIDGLEVWDSARLVTSHMASSADEAATLTRLAAIPKAARPEPLDRDLSRGVRGNRATAGP